MQTTYMFAETNCGYDYTKNKESEAKTLDVLFVVTLSKNNILPKSLVIRHHKHVCRCIYQANGKGSVLSSDGVTFALIDYERGLVYCTKEDCLFSYKYSEN